MESRRWDLCLRTEEVRLSRLVRDGTKDCIPARWEARDLHISPLLLSTPCICRFFLCICNLHIYLPSFWAYFDLSFFLCICDPHICPLLLNILWSVVFHTCTFWGPKFCTCNLLIGIWDGVTPLVYLVYFMPTSKQFYTSDVCGISDKY